MVDTGLLTAGVRCVTHIGTRLRSHGTRTSCTRALYTGTKGINFSYFLIAYLFVYLFTVPKDNVIRRIIQNISGMQTPEAI